MPKASLEALAQRWGLTPIRWQALPASKNHVLLAEDASGAWFFVKASPHSGDPGIRVEGQLLSALADLPGESSWAPRLRRFDFEARALALEWIPDATSLHAHQQEEPLEGGWAAAIGAALAEAHRALEGLSATARAALPRSTTGGDFLDRFLRLSPETYARLGTATVRLVGAVQSDEAILGVLAALWHLEGEGPGLVHGDLRWPNVLLAGERIVFVDWETAAPGPKERDLGSLTGEWLLAHALPSLGGRELPRSELFDALASLRAGYQSERPELELDWPLVIRFAAEALLRSAFTLTEQRTGFDERVEHLLGFIAALCSEPDEYAAQLFEIADG